MRGYDTLFVQRVKATLAAHEIPEVRKFLQACVARQTPVSDLARRFGVSRTTVYNWMTGQTVPHPRHVAAMKAAMRLPRPTKRK